MGPHRFLLQLFRSGVCEAGTLWVRSCPPGGAGRGCRDPEGKGMEQAAGGPVNKIKMRGRLVCRRYGI